MLKAKSKKCLVCNKTNLHKFLDLGATALANSLVYKKKKGDKFPLQVFFCKECYLVQLGHIVDRNLLFSSYNYFSGDSPQLEKYFEKYAQDIYEKFPQLRNELVLEIASNDGILLKKFKKLGYKILGVDPAKNIAKKANQLGLTTLPIFFNDKSAEKILRKFGKASIITANNVLAHSDNPNSIIQGVKKLLAKDGLFVFEVQYLGDLISKNEFDNVYHEHTCYFSLHPIKTMLFENNLKIFDVEKVAGQGGSIRIYAMHSTPATNEPQKIKKFLEKEMVLGLHEIETYKKFSKNPLKIKKDLFRLVSKIKKEGKIIAGYGASAKSATLLQFSKIDYKLIDYIVDVANIKQGKLTPGTHIPIKHPNYLKEKTPDYVLILAWNYKDSIIEKEKWLKERGVKFIIPIPEVEII